MEEKEQKKEDVPQYGKLTIREENSMMGLIEVLHVNGMRISPEILEFVVKMQNIFNLKKAHKGTSWKTLPLNALRAKLTHKTSRELMNDTFLKDVYGKTKEEAGLMVHIANYCWMIWQRRKGGDI